jgi:hypothetical protein
MGCDPARVEGGDHGGSRDGMQKKKGRISRPYLSMLSFYHIKLLKKCQLSRIIRFFMRIFGDFLQNSLFPPFFPSAAVTKENVKQYSTSTKPYNKYQYQKKPTHVIASLLYHTIYA